MQLNKVHPVKIVHHVAAELGETSDRLFDLAVAMTTEDGVTCAYSPGGEGVVGFTPFGTKNL